MTTTTCLHSTTSLTGCQPLCDQPATQHAFLPFYNGPLEILRCDQHVEHAKRHFRNADGVDLTFTRI